MREILFKAKRLDNGEWVEGHLVTRKYAFNNEVFEAHIITDAYEQYGVMNFGTTPVLISPVDNDCCFRVDHNTICQYTGLTDKNGNKIWENDVLRYSYDYPDSIWLKAKGLSNKDIKYSIGQVFWSDWRGSWSVCGKGTSRMTNNDVFTYCRNPNRTEVIGNIFDNTELLKN